MAQPAHRTLSETPSETPAQRELRLAWERDRLAEAEDDLRNGRFITGEELDTFLKNELAAAQAAVAREAE